MKKTDKAIFYFILTQIICLYANTKEMSFGDKYNSGFEKLTCEQIADKFEQEYSQSELNKSSLDTKYQNCSKMSVSLLSKTLNIANQRKKCFESLDVDIKKSKEMINSYIWVLKVRMQIYDSLNISKKNELTPDCYGVTAYSYVREKNVSDADYIRKHQLKCMLKLENEFISSDQLKRLYGSNIESYMQREKCRMQTYKYGNLDLDTYKPLEKTTDYKAADKEIKCVKYSCKFLLSQPTNNPSPCYRNQLIDCFTEGTSSAPDSTEKSKNNSTGI